jgi:NAD(P)-dependent dehydrogenase (short-subunit alcohol dehydrogenase family)
MKKAILITGVAKGIGHALVNKFIQEGYFVIGIVKSIETKLKD